MHIRKLANRDDRLHNSAYEILEVQTEGGQIRLLKIDRSKSNDLGYLYKEFLRANVALPADRRSALDELNSVIEQSPCERWVYANAAGWLDDQPAYLLGDELIGGDRDVRFLPPGGPDAQTRIVLQRRGKLSAWQRKVAAASLAYPPWAACLTAALAAPLIAACHWPSIRLHLFRGTEQRRMAGAAVAGSAVGFGAPRSSSFRRYQRANWLRWRAC